MVDWSNPTPTPTASLEPQSHDTPDIDEIAPPAKPAQAGYDFPYDATLEHDGLRSLSRIAIQAFWLGTSLAAGSIFTYFGIVNGNTYWRLSTFTICLSLFHFLEFWTTATFNPLVVRADSFLLFTNGSAYNTAYTLAILEIIMSVSVSPAYGQWMTGPVSRSIGLLLVLLGQSVRSLAMAQAGRNFNHTPQKSKKEGHTLVNTGIYSLLRHPSYFGFFWWAIGTQLLVGNKLCVVGYVLVLWRFFATRIRVEEVSLVNFFGDDYKRFKTRTGTGIPFIR